jgi:hypothetical protein
MNWPDLATRSGGRARTGVARISDRFDTMEVEVQKVTVLIYPYHIRLARCFV